MLSRRRMLLAVPAMAAAIAGLEACSSATPSSLDGSPETGTSGGPATTSATSSAAAPTTTGSLPVPSLALSRGGERVLNVVAHPDDDLLFLSPDLLTAIRHAGATRTIYLTAGDDGRNTTYWHGRMAGIFAAYAQMAGVANRWMPLTDAVTGLPGSTALALRAAPWVSVAFVKLPDGGAGKGFPSTGHASLPRLWEGSLTTIRAIDGSSHFTLGELIDGISAAIAAFGPTVIRTQDYLGHIGDGDHGDHHVTAYLTRKAWTAHRHGVEILSYQDYATSKRRMNLHGAPLAAKKAAFATYARHDSKVDWPSNHSGFGSWLDREYVLNRG